jgi:hypothetical protein
LDAAPGSLESQLSRLSRELFKVMGKFAGSEQVTGPDSGGFQGDLVALSNLQVPAEKMVAMRSFFSILSDEI